MSKTLSNTENRQSNNGFQTHTMYSSNSTPLILQTEIESFPFFSPWLIQFTSDYLCIIRVWRRRKKLSIKWEHIWQIHIFHSKIYQNQPVDKHFHHFPDERERKWWTHQTFRCGIQYSLIQRIILFPKHWPLKQKTECWMFHLEKKQQHTLSVQWQAVLFFTLTTLIWCTKDHKSSSVVFFILHVVFMKDTSIVKFKEGGKFMDWNLQSDKEDKVFLLIKRLISQLNWLVVGYNKYHHHHGDEMEPKDQISYDSYILSLVGESLTTLKSYDCWLWGLING